MFKYALLDYVPQRYLRRASFDTLENDRFILDLSQADAMRPTRLHGSSARLSH